MPLKQLLLPSQIRRNYILLLEVIRWGKRRASEGKYKEERQKGINSSQREGKAYGPARVKGVRSVRSVSPQLGAVTLHPAGTCSDALISQTEFMGDYHTAPAKLCCSAGNRYAPVLNPKRPCYICQACPGKAPSVQMLSLLCLHQKI